MNKRKPKDDEQSVTSESNKPMKNVPALMGEGEKFFRDQLYTKAIECYSEALEMSPGHTVALVERAACYMKIGKNDLALADAEESLKENRDYAKGLYQKAEALYAMGEFELALVFYHRGKKLRGDVKEFQLGINKAQEAIDNCVGDPHSVKLEIKGDLSYFDKPDEGKKKQSKLIFQKFSNQKQPVFQKREKRVQKTGTQKTIKELLGELYADKVYLEKLLDDDLATKPNTKTGDAIWSLANNGLDFLDSRTEFWRQQKPIYARKAQYKQTGGASEANNPIDYIVKQLEAVDNLQSNGKHAEALDKSNKLLNYVNKQNENVVHDKKAIISNIHSNIGNAHLEMGKYALALQSHQRDLELSKSSENKDGVSRAYENIGRVYARNGKYKDALQVWEKKLPMAENDMEKAWLYHEIGRCHIELGNYDTAIDFGKRCLEYSDKINDAVWQLNAVVLIAQSLAKKDNEASLTSAVEHFNRAIEMTEKQSDAMASSALKKVLAECQEKLVKLAASASVEEAKEENGAESPAPAAAASPAKEPERTESPRKQESKVDVKQEEQAESSDIEKSDEEVDREVRSSEKNSDNDTGNEDEPAKKPPSDAGSNREKSDVESKKSEISLGKAASTAATPAPAADSNDEANYELIITTGDKLASGTDSNVFLIIYGENGETPKLNLSALQVGRTDLFERGKTDVIQVKSKNVGKVTKLHVSHDGAGIGSGWFLESIELTSDADNQKVYFPVSRWMDEDEGDGKTALDLLPDQKPE